MIEQTPGGTIFTGQDTEVFRMLVLKSALGLELKGIRTTRRSAYAAVKLRYGLRGSKQRVYDELCKLVQSIKTQPHINK